MGINVEKIDIVQATLDDAAGLRNLRLQLVKENPRTYGVVYSTERRKNIDYFTNWIKESNRPDSAIFLMKYQDQLVGMGAVRWDKPQDPTIGYFGSLGTLKNYQHLGLGSMLIQYHLDWIKKHTQFKKVKTIVTKTNQPMLSLAKKFGFVITGEGSYYGVEEFYLEKILEK